jgi:hypothetical protein
MLVEGKPLVEKDIGALSLEIQLMRPFCIMA